MPAHRSSRTRLLLGLLAAFFVFAAAACGGDDDDTATDDGVTDDGGSDDSGSDDAGSDDAGSDDTDDSGSEDDSGDDGGSGEVGATVTIGDTTYVGTEEAQCITMGGALSAQFTDADGTVTIDISIPPEDYETDTQSDWPPPSVRVDDEIDPQGNLQWLAGTDVSQTLSGVAPDSGITEFTISDDGNGASGSGQFVESFEILGGSDGTLVDGTFEVQCAP